ncbi:hypothetical protein WMY93_034217, partial [Mugilogobius chulae]
MNQLVSDLCAQDQLCSESTLMPSLCCPDDLSLLTPDLCDLVESVSGGGGCLENDPFCLTLKSDSAPAPAAPSAALLQVTVRLCGNCCLRSSPAEVRLPRSSPTE